MLKTFGLAVYLIAAVSSADGLASLYGTLEPGHCYTWGVNPKTILPIEHGQIVAEAVLTIHNFRPEASDPNNAESIPRSSLRDEPPTQTPLMPETSNHDSLRIYVLDNPQDSFVRLNNNERDDPFAGFGSVLQAEYQEGDLVYRLGQTHDPNAWAAKVFGESASLTLADGTSVFMSSALLEFIDYAGAGGSVGFGIRPGNMRYYYDDITLTLTVLSYEGNPDTRTFVCHLPDKRTPVEEDPNPSPGDAYTLDITALNGKIAASPEKATYEHGETITLTAEPDTDYMFDCWSGDAVGPANPVTITMDGDKSVVAVFIESSRSSQRGK